MWKSSFVVGVSWDKSVNHSFILVRCEIQHRSWSLICHIEILTFQIFITEYRLVPSVDADQPLRTYLRKIFRNRSDKKIEANLRWPYTIKVHINFPRSQNAIWVVLKCSLQDPKLQSSKTYSELINRDIFVFCSDKTMTLPWANNSDYWCSFLLYWFFTILITFRKILICAKTSWD